MVEVCFVTAFIPGLSFFRPAQSAEIRGRKTMIMSGLVWAKLMWDDLCQEYDALSWDDPSGSYCTFF
jgi:hypothetical protein